MRNLFNRACGLISAMNPGGQVGAAIQGGLMLLSKNDPHQQNAPKPPSGFA